MGTIRIRNEESMFASTLRAERVAPAVTISAFLLFASGAGIPRVVV
jgi:hypothetical protein